VVYYLAVTADRTSFSNEGEGGTDEGEGGTDEGEGGTDEGEGGTDEGEGGTEKLTDKCEGESFKSDAICVTSDGSRKRGWGVGVGNSILLVALGVCTMYTGTLLSAHVQNIGNTRKKVFFSSIFKAQRETIYIHISALKLKQDWRREPEIHMKLFIVHTTKRKSRVFSAVFDFLSLAYSSMSMMETPRRSIMVTSSIHEISTDQLGNGLVVVAEGGGFTQSAHPLLRCWTNI
jgi:hypothetical protein